jgi:glutamine---fructose-6-phosphate transaminase (isomerizing)
MKHARTWPSVFSGRRIFLFLGRGIHYPIALEGALKLKEISYIHAEGYPAGEMKHGPNALIDENLPVVIVATRDANDPGSMLRYEKTMSNLKEVKARSGVVIALATEGDEEIKESADHVHLRSGMRRKNFRRFWKSFLCSCSPITSRCAAGAMSISRGIWRSR